MKKSLVTAATCGAALLLMASGMLACDEGDNTCTAPTLVPALYPVNMGSLVQKDANTVENPGSNDNPPFIVNLILSSTCTEPVVIEKACLVASNGNSGDSVGNFQISQPSDTTVPFNEETAIEILYDRNGSGGVENVALVIQSNATNFPTAIIPVCAQTVPTEKDRMAITCDPPVTVPEGTKDDTLCQ